MKFIKKLGTRLNKNGTPESWGEFLCPNTECNKIVERPLSQGKRDKSCGCTKGIGTKNHFKHGGTNTRLYNIWSHIKGRIFDPKNNRYKNYGGRGITICDEWLEFIPFRDWSLNNGYTDTLTIDRWPNNDGNYEPSNCRWVTRTENLRNTTRNVIKSIEQANEIRELHNTGNYTQKELAEKYDVSKCTISYIVNNKTWVN